MIRRLLLSFLLVAVLGTAVLPSIATAQAPAAFDWGSDKATSDAEARRNQALKVPTWLNSLGNAFLQLLYWVLTIFLWFVGVAMSLVGKFLDVILGVDYYARLSIVQEGWKFVRDALNFVFIFVLLAIAFSEIAGLETFQARRALPKLLLAALLVNFSLGIGGAINGVATCLMNTAITAIKIPSRPPLPLPATPGVCGGTDRMGTTLVAAIANSAGIGRYYVFEPSNILKAVGFDIPTFGAKAGVIVSGRAVTINLAAFLESAAAAFFMLLFLAALATLAILFFLRIAVILILLVLSPIPYALGIIPAAAGYARQWWEQFIKYVTFGPITIVLIVLIVKLLNDPTGATGLITQLGTSTASFGGGGGRAVDALASTGFFTMFVSAWILMTIVLGLRLGVMGAGMATGFGTRLARGVAGLPLIPARVAGRAAWARTGAPIAAGFKKQREEVARERERGWRGGAGRFFAAPLDAGARQREARRREDEQVKDLKARGVPLKQLKLGNVADARYAVQEGLHETASDDEVETITQTLTKGGRTGTGEFGRARTEFLKRLPHTGVKKLADMGALPKSEVATEQAKAVEKLGGLDYVKAMRKERDNGVILPTSYPVRGNHVRAVREYGDQRDAADLLAARGRGRWTPGAEAEFVRAPLGPTPPPPTPPAQTAYPLAPAGAPLPPGPPPPPSPVQPPRVGGGYGLAPTTPPSPLTPPSPVAPPPGGGGYGLAP